MNERWGLHPLPPSQNFFPEAGDDATRILQSRDGLRLENVHPIDHTKDCFNQLNSILYNAKQKAWELYGNERVMFGVPEAQFLQSSFLRFVQSLDDPFAKKLTILNCPATYST